MSWKTMIAVLVFGLLSVSLMWERAPRLTRTAAESEGKASSSFDFAITAGQLVYSESLQPIPSKNYLISKAAYNELRGQSVRVILDTLDALPGQSGNVVASRLDGAGPNSVNQ